MNDAYTKIVEKVLTIFEPFSEFICIFGSILEPRFNEKSDVDLAIMPLKHADASKIFRLKMDLEELISRDVDCIDLQTADPIISMQVIQNGKLIYSITPSAYHQFVARKISEYIDFKFSREIVEKNLVSERIITKS